MEQQHGDLFRIPGPGGDRGEFAVPHRRPVGTFPEPFLQQSRDRSSRPLPAVILRGPVNLCLVLLSVEPELREIDLLGIGVAPAAPDHVLSFTPDRHVDSTAASFGALGLGEPNLARNISHTQRRPGPHQISRILCRALIEHVGQDVSSIDNRPAFHPGRTGPERWHNDAEGQQTQLSSHCLMVSEVSAVVRCVSARGGGGQGLAWRGECHPFGT